jgi:signal peptidase II
LSAADRWGRTLAVCGLVVALDQGLKALVQSKLVPAEHVDVGLGFEIANVHNRGAAFGLFAGGQAPVIAVSLLAIVLLGIYLARNIARPGLWLAAGLVVGGALGNLADRLRIDAVTDFIDPPLWPAFNLADVAIVAGVALLLLGLPGRASTPER